MVRELQENLYVDDWLTGAESDQEVSEMYHEADGHSTDESSVSSLKVLGTRCGYLSWTAFHSLVLN